MFHHAPHGAAAVVPLDATQNVDPRLIAMFMKKPATVGIQNTVTHHIEPIRPPTITDTEYIFDLPNTGGAYLDFRNTEMYVKGYLAWKDGTRLKPDEKIVSANNFLYTLFNSVDIWVGHNQTEIHIANFPYKCFVQQLERNTIRDPGARRTQGLWSEWRDPRFDEKTYIDYEISNFRYDWVAESKTMEMLGPLLLGFTDTEGFMLPACPFRIRFRKSHEAFYTVAGGAGEVTQEYNFVIEKFTLNVLAINISPALAPLMDLQTDTAPAVYEFNSLDMKIFSIEQGAVLRRFSRVYENKLPKKILVAFYTQDSFSGQKTTSPLLTASADIRQVSLSVNGIILRELNTDFNKDEYTIAYRKFQEWLGHSNLPAAVSFTIFKHGYRYFAFNLMENCSGGDCSDDTISVGTIDINVTLGKALEEHCVMAVYCEAAEVLEISKERTCRHLKSIF